MDVDKLVWCLQNGSYSAKTKLQSLLNNVTSVIDAETLRSDTDSSLLNREENDNYVNGNQKNVVNLNVDLSKQNGYGDAPDLVIDSDGNLEIQPIDLCVEEYDGTITYGGETLAGSYADNEEVDSERDGLDDIIEFAPHEEAILTFLAAIVAIARCKPQYFTMGSSRTCVNGICGEETCIGGSCGNNQNLGLGGVLGPTMTSYQSCINGICANNGNYGLNPISGQTMTSYQSCVNGICEEKSCFGGVCGNNPNRGLGQITSRMLSDVNANEFNNWQKSLRRLHGVSGINPIRLPNTPRRRFDDDDRTSVNRERGRNNCNSWKYSARYLDRRNRNKNYIPESESTEE